MRNSNCINIRSTHTQTDRQQPPPRARSLTEYPLGLNLLRSTSGGPGGKGHFLISSFLCEMLHHNNSVTTLGFKISLFLRSDQRFPRYSQF